MITNNRLIILHAIYVNENLQVFELPINLLNVNLCDNLFVSRNIHIQFTNSVRSVVDPAIEINKQIEELRSQLAHNAISIIGHVYPIYDLQKTLQIDDDLFTCICDTTIGSGGV